MVSRESDFAGADGRAGGGVAERVGATRNIGPGARIGRARGWRSFKAVIASAEVRTDRVVATRVAPANGGCDGTLVGVAARHGGRRSRVSCQAGAIDRSRKVIANGAGTAVGRGALVDVDANAFGRRVPNVAPVATANVATDRVIANAVASANGGVRGALVLVRASRRRRGISSVPVETRAGERARRVGASRVGPAVVQGRRPALVNVRATRASRY